MSQAVKDNLDRAKRRRVKQEQPLEDKVFHTDGLASTFKSPTILQRIKAWLTR